MKLSFSRTGNLLKVHVVGQATELFSEILVPLVTREKLNKSIVTFEINGYKLSVKPTLSYDFTVIDQGGFLPHINTKQGPKQYYCTSNIQIRLGNFDVYVQ